MSTHFRILILIFLVYVLSVCITITPTYTEFLGTDLELLKVKNV